MFVHPRFLLGNDTLHVTGRDDNDKIALRAHGSRVYLGALVRGSTGTQFRILCCVRSMWLVGALMSIGS